MNKASQHSLLTFLLFPGIAMLLGWGLRGYIGGGPFGAMIPGAMVALAISILLGFRQGFTSILVVFGVVGIGLGGEMTYGQTLGFLRDPETVWWGNLATTIKGAVWGMGGGAMIGLGLIHRRIPRKTIIIALLLLLVGILLGFKLINDPKVIYFSDPMNKPRSESWAGLLFGAFALISYLKYSLAKKDFSIVGHFVFWGLIGGGLGFGLGGLWFVLGSQLQGSLFTSWWKMMEFTFGLLFGMGLGYAAWQSKDALEAEKQEGPEPSTEGLPRELLLILLIGLGVYLVFPIIVEPIAEKLSDDSGWLSAIFAGLFRMLSNYAFYGFVLILIALYRNDLAWQLGITLTFCHTAIDWARDLRPTPDTSLDPWIQLVIVVLSTMFVAWLVAVYRRKPGINNSMMQLLVWSTVAVAFVSLLSDIFIEGKFQYTDFASIVVRTLFVHIVFLSSAIYTSWQSRRITG